MPPVGDWLEHTAPEPPAEELPPPPPLPPPTGGASGPRRRKLVTWRASAFVVSVIAVLGVAGAAIGWYARASYFVAFDGNTVTLFKGRPGGVLWFKPTIEKRYSLQRSGVPPGKVPVLEKGKERPSVSAADDYVHNLEDEAASLGTATAATTTVPPVPTTAGSPGATQP